MRHTGRGADHASLGVILGSHANVVPVDTTAYAYQTESHGKSCPALQWPADGLRKITFATFPHGLSPDMDAAMAALEAVQLRKPRPLAPQCE